MEDQELRALRGTRESSALREITLDLKSISQAGGSSFFQFGQTKVICGVYGPRQARQAQAELAQVKCTVTIAPFSGSTHYQPPNPKRVERVGFSSYERLLAQQVVHAIKGAIRVERYPKSEIVIYLVVLQDDGGVLPAAINAASLALTDAGIEMTSLISAVHVGYAKGSFFVDPSHEEEERMEGVVTCAATVGPGGFTPGQPYACTHITSFVINGVFRPIPGMADDSSVSQALLLGLNGASVIGGAMHKAFLPPKIRRQREQQEQASQGAPKG